MTYKRTITVSIEAPTTPDAYRKFAILADALQNTIEYGINDPIDEADIQASVEDTSMTGTIAPMPQSCPNCSNEHDLYFEPMEYATDTRATEVVTCWECVISWENTWELSATRELD